jgi:pSer/pThr/pTyr-binding forkhead associated (FHA) protein
MRISLPKVRGCSVNSALRSGSMICRLSLAGGPVAREGLPPLQPDLKLDDTVPFRLSRNHFMIERRKGSYYVRDLSSRLGTIVNGEPIGEHFRGDDGAPLRAGENGDIGRRARRRTGPKKEGPVPSTFEDRQNGRAGRVTLRISPEMDGPVRRRSARKAATTLATRSAPQEFPTLAPPAAEVGN